MSRPRGNRSSAALIEKRRTRLLELKQEGKTTIEAEQILTAEGFPADRVTLWRDLKGMMVKLEVNNSETYLELKQEQDVILRRMEELLITEQVEPEVAREWRAIRKDISELWGLDAPNKSLHAHIDTEIDPAKLVGYRKFLYHTRHLSEADIIAKVYPFCDSLSPSVTPQYLLEPSEDMK
jgi:hypothetical protein